MTKVMVSEAAEIQIQPLGDGNRSSFTISLRLRGRIDLCRMTTLRLMGRDLGGEIIHSGCRCALQMFIVRPRNNLVDVPQISSS